MQGKAAVDDIRTPVAGFVLIEKGKVYSYSDNTVRREQFPDGIEKSSFEPACDSLLVYEVIRHAEDITPEMLLKPTNKNVLQYAKSRQ